MDFRNESEQIIEETDNQKYAEDFAAQLREYAIKISQKEKENNSND